jgi:hypothetical protein
MTSELVDSGAVTLENGLCVVAAATVTCVMVSREDDEVMGVNAEHESAAGVEKRRAERVEEAGRMGRT